MWKFYSFLLLAELLHGGQSAPTETPDCTTGAINGVIEIGCWGFRECVNGQVITHNCTATQQVLERDTLKCVYTGTGRTDCNKTYLDCSTIADGMYADLGDGCQTYVRCYGAVNVGRLYCPASLVFNNDLQTCDYPGNVVPPCGTAPFPSTTVVV